MALEPPPNIMRPGQIRGKIRTGAKTASKDQEREYLARFQRLADDPSVLVPVWRGEGPDPFARLRRKLERVRSRQGSERWLKWYARSKRLPGAYAATLLVLKQGKIPSFASIKFQGRDLKYVLRGRGKREKLAFVHNHEDAPVRLLGFLDEAKKGRLVVVSHDALLFASNAGRPLPEETLPAIFQNLELPATSNPEGLACAHVGAARAGVRYELPDVRAHVRFCRDCIERVGGTLETALEGYLLAPGGKLRVTRRPAGTPYRVHPETAAPDLVRLVEEAAQDALGKSTDYEQITDLDLLDWTKESLLARLDKRPQGYLLVDDDLWLGAFDDAAKTFGQNDIERRALAFSFAHRSPRIRTSDPSLTKLLAPVWKEQAVAILQHVSGGLLGPDDVLEFASKPPADALPGIARRMQTQERFREFPTYWELAPALQLAYDLFKARRTDDANFFQTRLGAGVQGRETRSVALALARVFNASAGLEWQYAPHEKDEAKFLEPYVRELSLGTPATFDPSLANLANALNLPAPRRKG